MGWGWKDEVVWDWKDREGCGWEDGEGWGLKWEREEEWRGPQCIFVYSIISFRCCLLQNSEEASLHLCVVVIEY